MCPSRVVHIISIGRARRSSGTTTPTVPTATARDRSRTPRPPSLSQVMMLCAHAWASHSRLHEATHSRSTRCYRSRANSHLYVCYCMAKHREVMSLGRKERCCCRHCEGAVLQSELQVLPSCSSPYGLGIHVFSDVRPDDLANVDSGLSQAELFSHAPVYSAVTTKVSAHLQHDGPSANRQQPSLRPPHENVRTDRCECCGVEFSLTLMAS